MITTSSGGKAGAAVFLGVGRKAILIVIAMWGCGQLDCGRAAAAEELAMPFGCAIVNGAPRLSPGAETRYKIIGKRDEQPFVACKAGGSLRCETMMVHKFVVECGGVRASWARVAEAARASGVAMPKNMPNGYAPVSAVGGRFVLPALTSSVVRETASVSTQSLSPDSVYEPNYLPVDRVANAWTTTVQADAAPETGGGARNVAVWVVALMLAMVAASLVATRSWRTSAIMLGGLANAIGDKSSGVFNLASVFIAKLQNRARARSASWESDDDGPVDHALFNASLMIHAKLCDAEYAVAALSPDLLLREVLQSELEQARKRIVDADRQSRSQASAKAAAAFRVVSRDLDRIQRTAHGASPAPHRDGCEDYDAPQSETEAYHVLGLNADAPPAAIKKLVDALRMTWHPDHARDETDRQRREARMKQINAAWDLLRDTRKAA